MGCLPAALGVCAGDRARDTRRRLRVHQGNGAATESSSGHAGAVGPGKAGGRDGNVQLGAADLVVVAQRFVGVIHEGSGHGEAAPLQRPLVKQLNEGARARNLGDDVPRASGQALVPEGCDCLVQVRRVGKLADAEEPGGLFAVRPTRAVLSVGERVLGARVDDEELEADPAEVEGNLAGGHIGAVEGQGMALLAAHGGGLIESSRVGTRDLVFGDASGVDELTSSLVVGGLQRSRQAEGAHLVQGDVAHSRAALEESPPPRGTHDHSAASKPGIGPCPAFSSAHATPARYAVQWLVTSPGPPLGPRTSRSRTSTASRVCGEISRIVRSARGESAT